MKNIFLIAIVTLTCTVTTLSANAASCTRVKGSWYGAFWFKKGRDCHRYNGCRHSILATVTHKSGNHYNAAVHPNVGPPGNFDITCTNGVVKSNDVKGIIAFDCIDKTVCQVKYDDERVSANMLSAGV